MKQAVIGKPRQGKGERTRQAILEAALQVIAEYGIRGVTHRAVAAAAGVQPSLTTYYFRDIQSLIAAAFTSFCERMRPGMDSIWQQVFDYLDAFTPGQLRQRATRQEITEELAKIARDYIVEQVRNKPTGLSVEQVFFTEVRLSPELESLARQHHDNLLAPLLELCRRFNRVDPEIDAQLLLDTITQLEYKALRTPGDAIDAIDEALILRLLRRQIGWILGLQGE
jgi:DNA-binding transcriptional regulator YbjK